MTVGTRVRVVLHGRRVAGWVVEDSVAPPEGVALRELAHVTGVGPPPELVSLAHWAAWRWAGPLASFLRTASPERAVRRLPTRSFAPVTSPAAPVDPAEPVDPTGPGGHPVEVAQASGGSPLVVRLAPDAPVLPLIERMVERRAGEGTVLVLAPALAVAERTATALERSGHAVARLPGQWDRAAAGWSVAVGSRAAAWSPPGRLAGAVVLDAHDEAYQEERAPTWEAWEVVAERCARDGAPCLLVSPCPTATLLDRASLWSPPRAAERAGWPRLEVEDRREADPRTGLLSERLVSLARRALDAGPAGGRRLAVGDAAYRPVVCVLNRRGRARLLACARCREVVRCERCGGAMDEPGMDDGGLRCRRCGATRPKVCAVCGSTRLKVLRPGVSRVREDLAALLRQEVAELTADTPLPSATAPVVVGTEAVLHRVRRASLVAFLDFDQHLLAPTFTAGESAVALLARAGRMVGGREHRPEGGDAPHCVLVQTRLPDHPVIAAAARGDPGPLATEELVLRRELDQPPARAWAVVSGPGSGEVTGQLPKGDDLVVSALPDERFLVSAPDHRGLCDALAAAGRPRERVRVEVDPRRV